MTDYLGMLRLEGRVALITGGGGIGRATAHGLAQAGAHVAVSDIDGEAARAVADEIGRGEAHRLDSAVVQVEHDESLGLADRSGLTAYDASYLWLACRMGADFVTPDRQLAATLTTDP
jgi:NAD(P)-dependent dehydrogenase (short-subunit alcohol dehydrogenase family)